MRIFGLLYVEVVIVLVAVFAVKHLIKKYYQGRQQYVWIELLQLPFEERSTANG